MRALITTIVALSLTGCATVFNGSNQSVEFNSDPDKAKVYVNGNYIGETPLKTNLDSKNQATVEFRKEGYVSKTVVDTRSMKGHWLLLDILPGFCLGFIPLLVDAITGDWNSLDQSRVAAAMEKTPKTAKTE